MRRNGKLRDEDPFSILNYYFILAVIVGLIILLMR